MVLFLGIFASILIFGLLISYICFRMAFYVSDRQRAESMRRLTPTGEIYEAYRTQMEAWAHETEKLPHRRVKVTSFDGLTLWGRFYEYAPGAPIEIMFHGYRGTALRDLSGGVQRCFSLGRSVLLVDQRAASMSGGHVITFGIHESRDALTWVDFVLRDQGENAVIILTGISMGASTVLIAAGNPLPGQVACVIADCGFHSAKDIIQKVIRDMHLPASILYPFVKLGARLFGRFNPEETSAEEAVAKSTVPVFFVHGEADDFVPCEMGKRLHKACASKKYLFTVPGAGHGLGYLKDTEGYINALTSFSEKNNIPIGSPKRRKS